MSVDMGGIAWPLRSQPGVMGATGGVALKSATLSSGVVQAGDEITLTVTGTDGQPVTTFDVGFTTGGSTTWQTAQAGTVRAPYSGRYSVQVRSGSSKVQAGTVRVL